MITEKRTERTAEIQNYQIVPEQMTEGRNNGLKFKNLKLSMFQRQLITGNRCEAFLNMKCVFRQDNTDIYYDTDRYVRLDEVLRSGMTGLDTVLIVCREFLEALRVCEDYLLSPADLSFRDEHLFCTEDISTVKFMYIPGYRNQMGVRDKLVDMVDTVIESDEGEDVIISCLSDYKNRLYTGSQDLRSLSILTEDTIRKNGPERRSSLQDAEQNKGISDNKKREKGNAVRFTGVEQSPFKRGDSGKKTAVMQEESEKYGTVDNKNENTTKIGTKLKHFFNEFVS